MQEGTSSTAKQIQGQNQVWFMAYKTCSDFLEESYQLFSFQMKSDQGGLIEDVP